MLSTLVLVVLVGSAHLPACNLDEHGVRVILIGEKGKGDAEFLLGAWREERVVLDQEMAPSLVKTR